MNPEKQVAFEVTIFVEDPPGNLKGNEYHVMLYTIPRIGEVMKLDVATNDVKSPVGCAYYEVVQILHDLYERDGANDEESEPIQNIVIFVNRAKDKRFAGGV